MMMLNENIKALNRAFERAFAHTATRKTLPDLLDCLGTELSCDRISIFEINAAGSCDNTYEWCREASMSDRDVLQNLPGNMFEKWAERLSKEELIIVRDIGEDCKCDICELLEKSGVHTLVVCGLAFHGRNLGFLVLENPSDVVLNDADEILPGVRYILSSLVYSDRLVTKLERVGYSDVLTGTGNRLGMHEYLESLSKDKNIGILYCDVIGWERADDNPEHMEAEQLLIHTGQVLRSVFGEECIFRTGENEFCVAAADMKESDFLENVTVAKNLFHQKDLLVATGVKWAEKCAESFDAMIRAANLLSFDTKKELTEEFKPVEVREHYQLAAFGLSLADIKLYYGDEFFERGNIWLSKLFDDNVASIVIDINYFKLYNDIFGRKAGKAFLEALSNSVQQFAYENGGIAGYCGGDNFCVMIPTKEDSPEKLLPFLKDEFEKLDYVDGFAPVLGVYLSTDRRDSVVTLYDRALTALAEIRGSYTEHIHFYSEEHFKNVRENKILLMEAKKAIPRGEFIFYVQPKVNVKTGRIIGGEALVRWNRKGQILSPGRFIEAMENSGYIFALDCYIWEEVCKWQRSLIDRGITPLPCSINVSRVDFYFTDIAEHIIELVKKYGLEPRLIGVEITETAFTDNMDTIKEAVEKLHNAGFLILMDDFGCGTSSLSMLHTMRLDILKTDVMFMRQSDSDKRAFSIVESVISMAHMIGMMVVTEGVETKEQRDNLLSFGDNYAQGYYFYKPMPVAEFEMLLKDGEKVELPPEKSDRIKIEAISFHDNGTMNETFIESIDVPAAIYRKHKDGCTLIQMNELYGRRIELTADDTAELDRYFSGLHKGNNTVQHIIHGSDTKDLTPAEQDDDIKNKVYLLYECEDHEVYLSVLND